MNTLAENWRAFKRLVMSPLAPPTQQSEMELAYYAGAEAVLRIVHALGDKNMSQQSVIEILKNMHAECRGFAEQRFGPAAAQRIVQEQRRLS